MADIDILVPSDGPRLWHAEIARRLAGAGHDARLVRGDAGDPCPRLLDGVLKVEARLGGRRAPMLWMQASERTAPPRFGATRLGPQADIQVMFDGETSIWKVGAVLLSGGLPSLSIRCHDRTVATAEPMVDARIQTGRGLDDVLARAVSLAVSTTLRIMAGNRLAALPAPERRQAPDALAGLLGTALPRAGREALRRTRHWPAHWRVGYRFHNGPGVAATGQLGGPDWSILPDDGQRYYADPFAFEHDGRHFVFVEEYPHALGKGVLSVAAFDAAGRPSTPQVILEEAHHLSYPQVFAHGGDIFMLPEAGASHALTLYRAKRFPDVWERHAVLIEGRELFDATLLDHGGRLWLLASERDGFGSTSDMMVAFSAERLEGPWTPHRMNPIAIDRAAARSGGAFVRIGKRIVRPVQDGTDGYGGGLGLSDLVRLDDDAVEFGRPVGILGREGWPYPRIHTLNRAGPLEVIDGLAEVRKVRAA